MDRLFAALAWGLLYLVGVAVSETYHPMAAHGDLLRIVRLGVLVVPVIVALTYFDLWASRKPLPTRLYKCGLAILAISAALPLIPSVDSGFRQGYWLGETLYEIPWQYGPRNGSAEPGGKYFVIEATAPDLTPRYETEDQTATLVKATDFNHGRGGPGPEHVCTADQFYFRCEWRGDGGVYSVSGLLDMRPKDDAGFLSNAEALLDSFAMGPN